MSDRVTVRIEDHVADVRLNRPDKLNALDLPLFQAIVETGERLAKERAVRAVVLSGEGRSFCAGLDFASFAAGLAESGGSESPLLRAETGRAASFAQRAAFVWRELPVPVIAALRGHVYGGGLQIALGADVRITAPDAQLAVMEIKWGLVPDMGGTQLLRRLVRLDVAKELTFTGRVVSGTEAVVLGLATRVAEDPFAEALALARVIASKSPDAIRAAKKLLEESALVDLDAGLRAEQEAQKSVLGKANQMEAVQANLGRREPKFEDG